MGQSRLQNNNNRNQIQMKPENKTNLEHGNQVQTKGKLSRSCSNRFSRKAHLQLLISTRNKGVGMSSSCQKKGMWQCGAVGMEEYLFGSPTCRGNLPVLLSPGWMYSAGKGREYLLHLTWCRGCLRADCPGSAGTASRVGRTSPPERRSDSPPSGTDPTPAAYSAYTPLLQSKEGLQD